jgi:hypothetical protein
MPRRLIPENIWEDEFYVPLPGEPRRIGPLADLFQRLLNRTEYVSNYIAAVLGLPWGATPPATLAGLAERMAALESQSGTDLSVPYDLAVFYPGTPSAGALLAAIVIPRDLSLQGGSVRVGTDPAANWIATIYNGGTTIGTVSVLAGQTTGTVSLNNSPTPLSAGSLLRVVGPSTADSAIRDISISFRGVV